MQDLIGPLREPQGTSDGDLAVAISVAEHELEEER